MSLVKAAPDGLKDHECEKLVLRERPPIPYVPEKDSVQETVSSFKEAHLKTLIKDVRSCEFLSGTPVRGRLFSSTWDQLVKRSRKRVTLSARHR